MSITQSPTTQPLPSARPWFHVAQIEPGVTLVAEPGYVFSWLISGTDDQLLVDTGMGLGDIRAAIADIAPDPQLVNSHAHFDHVGGNHLFDRRAIHSLGAPWLARSSDPDTPTEYHRLDFGSEFARMHVSAVYESWQTLVCADRTFHFLIGPEEEVRPWPELDPGSFAPAPPSPTMLVDEGHVFDLGSRKLTVIHTPGHAEEHICLLDEHNGILFAQDQAYYGPHYVCFESSDLETWVASATRLASELHGAIRIVYTAHSLRYSAPPKLLRELADAGSRVLAGEVTLDPVEAPEGAGLAADFGYFSIVVPQTFEISR